MPQIGIIGRQNVGKSTLFNALIKKKQSIVFNAPGVTRDLVEHKVNWGAGKWSLVDFPGFEANKKLGKDRLTKQAIDKGLSSIKDFHLLIWVISREGLNEYEHNLKSFLLKSEKEVWLAVNFIDDPGLEAEANNFYSLGFSRLYFVSALNNRGVKNLRNDIKQKFQSGEVEKKGETESLKIALIGKPNTGKSTLFNWLTKADKALVSEQAGTTRDSLSESFRFNNQTFELIDTAGIRKKQKINDKIELFSLNRTERALKSADVILLLLDASTGIDVQFKKIFNLFYDTPKPLVVLINKADLLQNQSALDSDVSRLQKQYWKFPFYYTVAPDGKKITKAMNALLEIEKMSQARYKTNHLNAVIERIHRNTILGSHGVKLKYINQNKDGLLFTLYTNQKIVPDNVKTYIRNSLSTALFEKKLPIKIIYKR